MVARAGFASEAWASRSDRPAVRALAQACWDHDGGLPQLVDDDFISRFFYGGNTIAGRDDLGELVAIALLTYDEAGHRIGSGPVHPSTRRQGHGEALVAWAREQSLGVPIKVIAETMPPEAETLFAASGLSRSFAEKVMSHDMVHISRIPLPEGVTTEPFTHERAHDFFIAYRKSFEDRPGFPTRARTSGCSGVAATLSSVPTTRGSPTARVRLRSASSRCRVTGSSR